MERSMGRLADDWKDRIGRDGRQKTAKAARNPIGSTMTSREKEKLAAALAAAAEKLQLFQKK